MKKSGTAAERQAIREKRLERLGYNMLDPMEDGISDEEFKWRLRARMKWAFWNRCLIPLISLIVAIIALIVVW